MSCSVHPSNQRMDSNLNQGKDSAFHSTRSPSFNPSQLAHKPDNNQPTSSSQDQNPPLDTSPSNTMAIKQPKLSNRGRSNCQKVSPFWETFDKMLADAYCPISNPNGVINMGIANNSLCETELLSYFHSNLHLSSSDLTYGTSLFGSTRFFSALCDKYYNQKGSPFNPFKKVEPNQIITGPGAGPILDQVFGQLCDEGDAVLVAAPDYNGFDADLSVRSSVLTVPIPPPDRSSGTSLADFQGSTSLRGFKDKLTELKSKGIETKAVISCNPHNPVGRCYDEDALIAYGRFCEENDLHLVFDEIYSLSVFPTQHNPRPEPFRSSLSIDWRSHSVNPSRVHLISSASKDFGMNGMRVGWFISQSNQDLINALKMTSKLYMLSSTSDALFSSLISNDDFFRSFIRMNRIRLSRSYDLARRFCEFHKIDYIPSNAGHFMLIDLKPYVELMRQQGTVTTTTTKTLSCGKVLETNVEHRVLTDSESETALWARGLSHKLLITPGSNYHHPALGIFRLTFSLPREIALEGFSRLEKVLGLDPWTPPAEEEIWSPEKDQASRSCLDLLASDEATARQAVEMEKEKKRKRANQVDQDDLDSSEKDESKGHWERFEEEVMGKRKRTTTNGSVDDVKEKESSPGPGEGMEFDPQMLKDLKGMQSACGSCMC